MTKNEQEIVALAQRVHEQYFSDITEVITFECQYRNGVAVAGQVLFQRPVKINLFYGVSWVIEPRYHGGWIPVIAHELAHLVNRADPESAMAERLPKNTMVIWRALQKTGEAECSIGGVK